MADVALIDEPERDVRPATVAKTVVGGRSRRYQSLDLWRGVACLAVVIYHATMQVVPTVQPGETWASQLGYAIVQVTGLLWIGVPMFFVISGYCILATLDKSVVRGDSLGGYFFRRFRRIYPPYWIALAVSVAVIALVETSIAPGLFTKGIFTVYGPATLDTGQWFGNITLTESWRDHIAGSTTRFVLPHVWTLCYEEQFYAVAGLILLVAPRRMFAASGVVSIGVVAAMLLSRRFGFSLEGTFLDGRWLLFAAGILAYYGVNYATPRGQLAIGVALVTAMMLLLVGGKVPWAIYLDHDLERFTALAFALARLVLHRFDAAICRTRWLAPLFGCGTMCYSLYLVHALVAKGIGHAMFRSGATGLLPTLLVTVPLSVGLSVAVGWAFHVMVERRFLNRA